MADSTPSHLEPDDFLKSVISEAQSECEKDYNETWGDQYHSSNTDSEGEEEEAPEVSKYTREDDY